jgi:signal transduction histidine kinase
MFQRRDGSIFLGRISGAWFRWDEGQEGMAFSIHDISDVKTIEHSFKQAEQEAYLGRLINDINHQIINPVMAIGGFARRLQGECGNSHHPQVILSEALRLEKLLNTISRFTRLPRPKSERVLFSQLVSEIDSRIGSQVRENGCKWQCSCTVELLNKKLHVDRERLFEALADIAENGCESYSLVPDKKEKLVTCEIVARDDIAFPYRIKITDHGCGIAAETLPHVFSHFFTEKTGHVGMGLTFTRRIVEEQGGRVEIQSEPGSGTSVSIYLVKERRRALRTERMC